MKTITIKANGLSKYDDVSPFVVTDNDLEIKVILPDKSGEFFLVAENNGRTETRRIIRDVAIQFKGLTAGDFKAVVKHYLKGALIKTYTVESLILIEADKSLIATPEISDLANKYAALVRQFANYKATVEQANATELSKQRQTTLKLIKFSYKDYLKNIYLGGIDFDGFIKEFGFTDLTADEIKFIKGE